MARQRNTLNKPLVIRPPGQSTPSLLDRLIPHGETCPCSHCLAKFTQRLSIGPEPFPLTLAREDPAERERRHEREAARRHKIHDALAHDLFPDELQDLLERLEEESKEITLVDILGVPNPGYDLDRQAIKRALELHQQGYAMLRLHCEQAHRNMLGAMLELLDQEYPGHCLGSALRNGDAILLREE